MPMIRLSLRKVMVSPFADRAKSALRVAVSVTAWPTVLFTGFTLRASAGCAGVTRRFPEA